MENNWDSIKKYKWQWDQAPPELARWSSELKGRSQSSIDAPYFIKARSNKPKNLNNSVDFDIKESKFAENDFVIIEENGDAHSDKNEGPWK